MPDIHATDDLVIGSGRLRASVRPQAGGRMSRLVHDAAGDLLVPMASDRFLPFDWPKAGAYPLFPFHNRVIGGLLHHAGQDYRLAPHPALAPDAMHGPAHRRAWSVIRQHPDALHLALAYVADADWPFDFLAEQEFSVDGDRLTVHLRLTNTGKVTMPGGLGWHPYFNAGLRALAETDARLAYPLDAVNLPTDADPVERLETSLPDRPGYTIHLTRWSNARLQTDRDGWIEIRPLSGLAHLAVHRMPDYICIEPVSHRAGTLGACENLRETDGLAFLKPGASIEASLTVTVTPASATSA